MAIETTGGYSMGYKPRLVRGFAKAIAASLPEHMRHYGAESIVVMGSSGVSAAFAALMLIDFPLFLVRKDNDNSHGSPIEGPTGLYLKDYLILDDFVDSGRTVRQIIHNIDTAAEMRCSPDDRRPQCKGVVQYKRMVDQDEDCRAVLYKPGMNPDVLVERRMEGWVKIPRLGMTCPIPTF